MSVTIRSGSCRPATHTGTEGLYRTAAAIHSELDCEAVLDGEIVILDQEGRPQFYELCSVAVGNRSTMSSICFGWMARICGPAR